MPLSVPWRRIACALLVVVYAVLEICTDSKLVNSLNYVVTSTNKLASTDASINDTKDEHKQLEATVEICPKEPCGLSLVFMGDSLTRFQYYSLAYFLRHGKWIDPESRRSLVRPMDFLGGSELNFEWSPWFNASMAELAPYENCDCYREAGRLNGQKGKLRYICENRYYYDPIRNNRVTYIQSFGTAITIRGHWESKKASQQLADYYKYPNESAIGETVGPMIVRVPYLWEGDWMDAIRGHISELEPALLVMNAGKWAHSFHEEVFRASIMNALNDTSIPRVIWKKTTANRGGIYKRAWKETDDAMCALIECMDTTWTVQVPENLYVDQVHFLEPVYRLLNEQLLKQLGFTIPSVVSSLPNRSSVPWYPTPTIPGLVTLMRS